MKSALTSAAVCAVAAMVSTIGLTPASAAPAQTVTPSIGEHALTALSEEGLQAPGARDASGQTSQIANQSTRNLPDVFRAPAALERLRFADSGTLGTFGGERSAQSAALTNGDSGADSGQGELDGGDASVPAQSPSRSAKSQDGQEAQGELDGGQKSAQPTPEISGGVEDKTEDGVKIAAISDPLDVPSDHASVVGVTSAVENGAKIEVRTRTGADQWGDWSALDYEASESDGGGGTPGTAPFVVSDASAVQIRVLGERAPEGAKLVIVDPKKSAGDSAAVSANAPATRAQAAAPDAAQQGTAGQAAGADGTAAAQSAAFSAGSATVENTAVKKVSKPAIASRSAWGANESIRKGSPSYASSIKAAIVHQTEGSNSYSATDVPGIIRGIYSFHVKERGWADIGYNVLVDRFGRAWQGRAGNVDKPVVGAHARGYNSGTFGISVMGSFNKAQPSSAAVTAVENTIAWKLSGSGVDAKSKATVAGRTINAISGHRDVGNTDCPGANLYAKLPAIRTAVAKMQSSGQSKPAETQQPTQKPAQQTTIQKAYKGREKQLGAPVGRETKLDDGAFQQYRNGYITWQSGKGTKVIAGAIARAWNAQTRKALGLPKNGEAKLAGGAYQSFARGDIHWSKAGGAHATSGDIRRYWGAKGYERGHLGYPTSDATCTGSERCEQNFTGGRVAWTKGVGVTESSLGGSLNAGVRDQNPAPSTPAPTKKPTPAPTPTQTKKPTPKPTQTKKPAKKKTKAQLQAEQRKAIIKEARKHLGVRYVWGGTSPTRGWDCSGYVQYVFAKNGIKLPRTSGAQKAVGEVIRVSQAKPGDLVWHPGHIAIVSDKKGYLIDAGSPRTDTSERKWDWMLNSGGRIIRVID